MDGYDEQNEGADATEAENLGDNDTTQEPITGDQGTDPGSIGQSTDQFDPDKAVATSAADPSTQSGNPQPAEGEGEESGESEGEGDGEAADQESEGEGNGEDEDNGSGL